MHNLTYEEFLKLSSKEKCIRYKDLSDHDKFLARINAPLEAQPVKDTFQNKNITKSNGEINEKEINMGFDDSNYDEQFRKMILRGRENKNIIDEFLKILIERIINGLTTYENEINSLPIKYRKKFKNMYNMYKYKLKL